MGLMYMSALNHSNLPTENTPTNPERRETQKLKITSEKANYLTTQISRSMV